MPVAAVTAGGTPSVSSGSANTTFARIAGEKITRLTCESSSLITLLRPTSLPVPEVVGSATKYGSTAVIGRTCGWSQTYSITSPGWVASRPTTLATSSTAPPPTPTTQSAVWAL